MSSCSLEKDTSDWKTGKLNGKRPLTTQKEQKADYGASLYSFFYRFRVFI
jgi:hypothetical protein